MNRLKSLPPFDANWFWERVEVSDAEACWPWKKYTTPRGYGVVRKDSTIYRAHRVALGIATGEDYPELLACHHCDNPKCCNPAHLYWGTQKVNMQDRTERGRIHLKHGVRNPRSKLNPEKVLEIRGLAGTMTITELAQRFGVSRRTISMVIQNQTWGENSMNPA
jgi:hypothetical protein